MEIRIELLSASPRLREQVTDEIIAKHPSTVYGEGKHLTLDCMDELTREQVIDCLSEGSLEYIDTVEVGTPKKKEPIVTEPSPFKTAYELLE